jgi:outer membrane lipoprotein-sorting protein
MDQLRRRGRRSWRMASAGAVITVGAVLAGTLMANAAAPALPKRTPAQLLVDMTHAVVPSAMTAVVTESANLGFPAIPNIAGLSSSALSAASLITGTHTVDIWYASPRQVRIALPVSFGETDLRINGSQVWLWDSSTQTATRFIVPSPFQLRPSVPRVHLRASAPTKSAVRPKPVRVIRPAPVTRPKSTGSSKPLGKPVRVALPKPVARAVPVTHPKQAKPGQASKPLPLSVPPGLTAPTPLQIARMVLAQVGPTTKVTVQGTATVAGRSAYRLVIAPRSDQSLISQIVIAVDAKTYLPLQVQVFGAGMSSPAFQIGFTSLTIGRPAASNFAFTPPPGAKVKTLRFPGILPGLIPGMPSVGGLLPGVGALPGGAMRPVVVPRGALGPRGARARAARVRVVRVRVVKVHGSKQRVAIVGVTKVALPPMLPQSAFAAAGPRVLGSGWLTVVVLPEVGAELSVLGSAAHPMSGIGLHRVARYVPAVGSGAYQSTLTINMAGPSGSAGQVLALLRILLKAATPVHGSWGSGKLLRTSLFSVLITSKGQVLIGAVTPAVLYADAAKAK